MQKAVIILLLIGFVAISGCTDSGYSGTQTNNDTQNNRTNTHTNTIGSRGSPPLVSSSTLSPSNPSLGESSTLDLTIQGENGINQIKWSSSKAFSDGSSGFFNCNLQKTCTTQFEFTPLEEGLHQIVVYAVDPYGQESSKSNFDISVGPMRSGGSGTTTNTGTNTNTYTFTCGNSFCEGGESYLNCEQDCYANATIGTRQNDGACEPGESVDNSPNDCETINPSCGNNVCDTDETRSTCLADCEEETINDNSCSTNSDCGYKQRCRSGKCKSVECTNDAQCGSNQRCSDNVCRTNYY